MRFLTNLLGGPNRTQSLRHTSSRVKFVYIMRSKGLFDPFEIHIQKSYSNKQFQLYFSSKEDTIKIDSLTVQMKSNIFTELLVQAHE